MRIVTAMTDDVAGEARPGARLRVLVAPDSFGDTLTAVAAAEAIGTGWSAARPGDTVTLAPQSDGGPGFVAVLTTRFGEVQTATVAGPMGNRVTARWLLDERGGAATAYVESAQACGLSLIPAPPNPRSAWAATTRGVGELIAAALAAGAGRIVVGLGGSATSDGGRGLIEALGGPAAAKSALAAVDLVIAADVTNPLLGPAGAAAVFGPQKGADADTVSRLEARLGDWAEVLAELAGRAVADQPGAGAAGGLGAALLALGGRRVPGAEVVAEATDRRALVRAADLVITGEGRLDGQTLRGKVVAALATSAGLAGIPAIALAGQVALTAPEIREVGIRAAYQIVEVTGSVEQAVRQAATGLTELSRQVAAAWPAAPIPAPPGDNGQAESGAGMGE